MENTKQLKKIEKLSLKLIERMPALQKPRKTLSEAALQAFEKKHEVRLPLGFRDFLLYFGEEAILPVVIGKRALPLAESTENAIYKSFRGKLKDPFIYEGKKPIALKWDDEKDDYAHLTPLEGTLCLGSGGCDILWLLVIQGVEAGNVWSFAFTSDQALDPSGLDFLAWCTKELEAQIEELEKFNRSSKS